MLISLAFVAIDQARAQVKIGVLTDLSSAYPDMSGKGSVSAAQMAADDFGPVLGKPIEVASANHENSPDVATAIARTSFCFCREIFSTASATAEEPPSVIMSTPSASYQRRAMPEATSGLF